jgi:hypothetical protein
VEFLGLAAPEWFSFNWVFILSTKISVFFTFRCAYFCWHFTHTLFFYLEVNFNFQGWWPWDYTSNCTSFWLTSRLSVPSSRFMCLLYQPILSQRLWSLLAYSSLKITLMLIHRVMSELMFISRSMPSLPCTDCSRRLFCTIYGPQLVGVSLFWRGLNFCMFCLWGCLFTCAGTSSTVCLRWEMITLQGFLLHAWSWSSVSSLWLKSYSEPRMRVQDPLGSQTLMKSNAQLRHEGQDEAPQPPPVQFELPTIASSSQTAPPPPPYDAGYA